MAFSLSQLRRYKSEWGPFELIVQGCFPRLHEEGLAPRRFYNGYLQTYVERDVRALIQLRDLGQFQKFLTLLAGRVGQVVNLTSLSNDVGVSGTSIRNWLSVLKASYVVFELPPFFENIRKRVIKSPKIYFTDVGLAAFLLGIHTEEQASRDPLRGNLYENLVIADIVKGVHPGNVTVAFSRGAGGAVEGQAAESYLLRWTGENLLLSPSREPRFIVLPEMGGVRYGTASFNRPLLDEKDAVPYGTKEYQTTRKARVHQPGHCRSRGP